MARMTAKDIARRLDISPAAVSMALNGKPGVSEETREQIIAEAVKCGYITPRASRGNSKSLPVISFVVYVGQGIAAETSFSTFVLQGVEAEAKSLGYRVELHYLYESQPIEEQLSTISNDTGGIILLGTDIPGSKRDLVSELFANSNTPIVVVDNFQFASYVDCVGNDNIFGTKAAVSYLIKCGHRKIGYIRSKKRIATFEDRENGVRIALLDGADLNLAPLQIIDVDISSERAYNDVCKWIEAGNVPTGAYFAENDVLAAAAIRAFSAHGYSIPEDISIIGFDDVPICEMTRPTITTMHSFKEQLGEVSVTQLHKRIMGGDGVDNKTGTLKIAISLFVKERDSVKKLI